MVTLPPAVRRVASDDASTTALFWLGEKTCEPSRVMMTDALSAFVALAGALAGGLFWHALRHDARSLTLLYDLFIPGLASFALFTALLLSLRTVARRTPFGRKSLMVSGASALFAFSCFYRALNIADEGAATSRGAPSAFNAPVSGRFVATVGEVALVVQVALYIAETARRLDASQGLWRRALGYYVHVPFSTMSTVLCAEALSWSGVLSGNSRFYCAEYVLWMLIATTWAWDGAELLHKSKRWSDQLTHAALLFAGLALFLFNACFEIPHFFTYQRDAAPAGQHEHLGIWECWQQRDSPLWLKRLPFFFCYFVGCSWASVAMTYRFMRRNEPRRRHRRSKSHEAVAAPDGARGVGAAAAKAA